jgi:Endonuclease/Exonuclease/phosphatase family
MERRILGLGLFFGLWACTGFSPNSDVATEPARDAGREDAGAQGDGERSLDSSDVSDASDAQPSDGSTKNALPFRLLQANVGNVALTCQAYKYKLCDTNVEARIASEIARLKPDIVMLQEVVPSELCAAMGVESNPSRACNAARLAAEAEAEQARRLVGKDFTIACDSRSHYDCIAVRSGYGAIEGCGLGAFCKGAPAGRTAPMPAGCDDGFTASAFTILPAGGAPSFRVVNAHPPSGGAVDCRSNQIEWMFSTPKNLVGRGPALISGDLNMDPYSGTDNSVVEFRKHVGPGKRFAYHSGVAEREPPYNTAFYLSGNVVFDHVASDFAKGKCVTLGEAPGTSRLDGNGGTDHRGLFCELTP